MHVEFVPSSNGFQPELGRFRFRVEDCVDYLQRQFEEYSIPLDGALLQWLSKVAETQHMMQPVCIPEQFEERARFLVEELWDQPERCEIHCVKCNQTLTSTEVSVVDWDEGTDNQGIKVGASGLRLICPIGHSLISICLRLY